MIAVCDVVTVGSVSEPSAAVCCGNWDGADQC